MSEAAVDVPLVAAKEPAGLAPLRPVPADLAPLRPVPAARPSPWTPLNALGTLASGVSFVALFFVLAAVLYALCGGLAKLLGDNPLRSGGLGQSIGALVGILLLFVMITATLLTIAERKWSALMQDRIGPNRARLPIPFLKDRALRGIPHLVADVLKMLTKEDFLPIKSSALLFNLAPILAFAPAFALVMVVPFGPDATIFDQRVALQIAHVDPGVLVLFATASIAVYGTALAGWSSNNKFALLGGLRASAQLVSYEVSLGLTLVGVILLYGTLQLDQMAAAQGASYALARSGGDDLLFGLLPAWGVVFQPIGFLMYFTAAGAEVKRAPFDLPEAESEIIGYFVEYSGLKFGMFMIAEFVEVVVLSATFVVIFFGGWHLPWVEPLLAPHVTPLAFAIIQVGFFLLKVVFLCWVQLVVRWTFPRFRYDQLMHLGWKILLPLSLANVLLTGFLLLWGGRPAMAWAGIVEWVVLLALIGWTVQSKRAAPAAAGHDSHATH